MELIETVLCYCFGLTNIFLLLYLMVLIFQKRKEHPYSKTSPFCSLFFIFCIFFHQVLYFIMSWVVYRDNLAVIKRIKVISTINSHCLFILPIIARMKAVLNLAKYNYYHLTYASQSQNFSVQASDDYFIKRLNNPNQDYLMFKYGFGIFFSVNLLLYFLLKFTTTKCLLYNVTSFSKTLFDLECNYNLPYQLIIFDTVKNICYFGEMFYFVYNLFSLWMYPLSSDIFYIRFEFLINLSWFLFHNVYHWYVQFTPDVTFFSQFLFNDVNDFSFLIMHLFLIQQRKKKPKKKNKVKAVDNKPKYISIINTYSKFMRNYICFSYFKNYIKERQQFTSHSNLLNFWVDYYLFKLHLKKSNVLKKTDLIIHAYYIYCNYFRRESIKLSTQENGGGIIDIPIETLDKIEKASQIGFCMTRTELDKVFDEAFEYIDNILLNIYIGMLRNKHNIKRLSNIFLHTEFDELKEEVINEHND